MTLDPFRQAGCLCSSLGDNVRAGIDGVQLDYCPLHEADLIEEQRVEGERAAAEAERDRLRSTVHGARTDLAPAEPVCSCVDLKTGLHLMLSGGEVPACAVHDQAAARQGSSISPGDDVGIAHLIQGHLGVPVTFNGGDLPPAA